MADNIDPPNILTSLGTEGAKTLATVTKTPPQMHGISSRWLLRLLPWVQTAGGLYRVNRRRVVRIDAGRVSFTGPTDDPVVVGESLRALPMLREFGDTDVLNGLAALFEVGSFGEGETLTTLGESINQLILIVHGKVELRRAGKYGEDIAVDLIGGGDFLGAVTGGNQNWESTALARTGVSVMRVGFQQLVPFLANNPGLAQHLLAYQDSLDAPQNADGEALVHVSTGHGPESELTPTFVDYDPGPREYGLSTAQTVLRINTRVADLYNHPMNQTEQQLRLTLEALREKQESELINNPEFGLLGAAEVGQRAFTQSGPPTPDDFDRLLELVWKDPSFFLAHPRTIAAFGNECSRRGIYPTNIDMLGRQVPAWRGIPIFPSNKIPVSSAHTSSVLLMRTGEDARGVVGLHQAGIPDEVEPSVSVRFMGIDERAVMSYLVTIYYSAAVLVPDAIAVLEDVQLGRFPPA